MKRILLMPFIFIYKFFKYAFSGFMYLPLIIWNFFSHAILTIQILFGTIRHYFMWKDMERKQQELVTYKKPKYTLGEKVEMLGNKALGKKQGKKRVPIDIDFNGADAKKSKIKQTYMYEVLDKDGRTKVGYFDAFSKVEVYSYLLNEGYKVIYNIQTSSWIRMFNKGGATGSAKIKTKDLIFMITQLSTYIKAGIPLMDSVKILTKQFKNKTYQKILSAVAYELSVGENFSSALEKQGDAFPKLLINMIRASEMTGELPETLDDMEEYYTEIESTRKAMVSAMMYPVIIFVIAIGVGLFIMLYVVPQFVEIYASLDTELPGITKFVLWLSSFLSDYAILLAVGFILLLLVFMYFYRNIKAFRTVIQNITMRLPVFGNIIIYNEVTMFTKTFSSLLSHNVFITDSMDILNKVTNNEIYKSLILDAVTQIAKGGKLSTAFKDHWAFPVSAYEMIVTGEMTGQLAEMMKKVSAYYQDLHKNAVARMKTFIEPIMIILLTIMVGVIVLAIVVPMFNMYSAIQD